ncbi:MAG: hypothetical protein ACOZF0_15890 [Thermodesulfobacteriota bacterium]
MLDISVAYNRYKFIGNEFLTWLWFMIDNEPARLFASPDENREIRIGNRLVMEKGIENIVEKITIKGDDAGLEEGILALRKGALVTEMHLQYKENEMTWMFSLKGESLNLSSVKLPETGPMESKEDIEAAVLDKIYLYEKATAVVHELFSRFIRLRISPDWQKTTIPAVRKWLAA